MQINSKIFPTCLIIGLLLINACTPNSNEENNQAALGNETTLPTQPAVRFINLSSVQITLDTQQAPTPIPTFTPKPTLTLLPRMNNSTVEPQSIEQALPSPTACINKAEIVKHPSVPPNTAFHSGDHFAKVWLIKNSGTCVWTLEYKFIFTGGDLMEAMEQEIPILKPIMPGETVEIKVQMTAPQTPNTYTSNWMFEDNFGNLFGVGDNSDQSLQVVIIIPFVIRNTPT
jgi:hypothetical protein